MTHESVWKRLVKTLILVLNSKTAITKALKYGAVFHFFFLSSWVQVDEQLALLQHEKLDLLKRLEEDQEDLNELMKKHKTLIAQVLLYSLFFESF